CQYFTNQENNIVIRNRSTLTLIPNIDMMKINIESGQLVHIQTNSLGFRDHEPAIPKPKGISRIAIIGDSYVDAIQVESEHRFSDILEQQLENETNRNNDWEVINFGVMSTGPLDQHLRYLHHIRQCEPDIVILCFGMEQDLGGSDLQTSRTRRNTLKERSPTELQEQAFVGFKSFLDSNIKLYEWQKARVDFLKHRLVPIFNYRSLSRPIHHNDTYYFDPLTTEQEQSINQLAEMLLKFRSDVVADSAIFLIVGMPTGITVYDDTWQALVDNAHEQGYTQQMSRNQPIEILSSICEKVGIPLLPLELQFQKGYESGELDSKQNIHYNRKGHLTPFGHEVVADSLYKFLQSQPWWNQPAENSLQPAQHIAVEPTNEPL
ncbi:SGNH/GDSL hydrolase family protein, partial [bacterium]|nr:SGNH/GDSL hydrolase family protein [bacterium]